MSDLFQHIEELYYDENRLKRLLVFTDRYITTHNFFVPSDFDAEDILMRVVEKNLKGSRGQGFDPNKGSIDGWLKRQIKSEIRNMSKWSRSHSELPTEEDLSENYHVTTSEEHTFPVGSSGNPENVFITEEQSQDYWLEILLLVEGDEDLEVLVKALESGLDIKKRRILSEELNWDMNQTNNVLKRFRRKVRDGMGGKHEPA